MNTTFSLSDSNWKAPNFNSSPLYNLEAERAVLSAMIEAPNEVCDEISSFLFVDDFFHPIHNIIYDSIMELYAENGKDFDLIALHERCKKKACSEAVTLASLAEIVSQNVTYLTFRSNSKIVKDLSTLRRLLEKLNGAAELIHLRQLDPEKIVSQIEKDISDFSDQEIVFENAPISKDIQDLSERIITWSEGTSQVRGLASGFPTLDKLTTGFNPGELIIIAARPGVGKSAMMLSMIRNMAINSIPIQCFSLEMPRQQLEMRLLSIHTCIAMQSMKGGTLGEFDKQKLRELTLQIKKWPIWIDDQCSLDIAQVRARSRRAVRKNGCQAIFVDYLQLLHAAKHRNRQEEVSYISRSLKGMARELGVPVFALAQVNRQGVNELPGLHHLKESGSIEQDADDVFFLHKEGDTTNSENNSTNSLSYNVLSLIIAKQRNGPTGIVPVRFYGWKTAFEEGK